MAEQKRRHIVIISYHYPPVQGSSGVQRILSLTKYLPDSNWQPSVLSVSKIAYPRIRTENESLIPDGVAVVRALALDAQRHLSILGRYPDFLALPDRWQSWIAPGVISGLNLIRKTRPSVIFSSFPIPSAHIIGLILHKITKIPWIADMRDPMVLDKHPPPGRVRELYLKIERQVFKDAAAVIVTTPGAASIYKERYSNSASQKLWVVENGFDADIFDSVENRLRTIKPRRKLKMLHSGLIYSEARNPLPLFRALSDFRRRGVISDENFEVAFRACEQESYIEKLSEEFQLKKMVSVLPPVSYEDAIEEMFESDSLLILQSADCNNQIPAKVYEYLRCGRPILALTDPLGDTGTLLSQYAHVHIGALEDDAQIHNALSKHIDIMMNSGAFVLPDFDAGRFSRRNRASEFAKIFDRIAVEKL